MLKIGDRFKIITHEWDDIYVWAAYGVEGVIVEEKRYDGKEPYWIGKLDNGSHGSFNACHIEIIPQQIMRPDVSLDEIHAFQEMMNASSGR